MVVIDNFGKLGGKIPLENKNAQSKTDAFSEIVETSKRKPNLLESTDGKDYVIKISNELLNYYNLKRYSGNTTLRAKLAERNNKS